MESVNPKLAEQRATKLVQEANAQKPVVELSDDDLSQVAGGAPNVGWSLPNKGW